MKSTLWRYSWRNTRRRPLRALLTLSGIVIGVATVVAVSILTHTMRGTYEQAFDSLIGKASLEIVSDGLLGFDQSLVQQVERLAEVDVAVGVIQTGCALLTRKGTVPLMVLAVEANRDHLVRDYEVVEGELLNSESPGILVGQDFAELHDFGVGDKLRLVGPTGLISWPVCGIVKSTGAARFNGGSIGFVALKQGQRRLKMKDEVNGIHLVLGESSRRSVVQSKVAEQIPAGTYVQTSHDRSELAGDAIASLEMLMSALGVVSLGAGGVVILNTFRMNLEERRQQLAVLRALGATKPQVTRLLLQEATLYGAVGTALGIGVGLLLAVLMRPGVGALFGAAAPRLVVNAEPILLAILLGPFVTMVATYFPARRASRRFVLSDLLTRREVGTASRRVWPRYLGLVLLIVGAGIVTAFHYADLPIEMARTLLPIAMLCLISGVVCSLSWVLGPIQYWVHGGVSRLFGLEGRLAVRELDRNPSRTATTIGVLVVALMVSIGQGNEITSSLRHLNGWFDKLAMVDFFVTGSLGDVSFSLTPVTLPESMANEISQLPSVDHVTRTSFLVSRVQGKLALVMVNEHAEGGPSILSFARDSPPDAAARLARGEGVVIGTGLAQRKGLEVGDEVRVSTTKASAKLTVVGTATDYYVGGMTVHIDRDLALEYFDLDGAHAYNVTSTGGNTERTAGELTAYCEEHALSFFSFADLKSGLHARLDNTFALLWAMMGMVFLVASLAVVNMLAMNILDQTRELGVLRAIGMQRGQIHKMILIQSLTIALVSLLPGIVAGVAVALMMNIPAESLTGHSIEFVIHPRIIAMAVTTAMFVTLAAAWIPSLYATRKPIVDAVKYE